MPFSDIIGHAREIDVLRRAILSRRVAHAFLFSGPEGVGKRLVALELARALNCARLEGDSCGACPDCEAFGAGTHQNLADIWPTVKVRENEYENALDGGGLIRIHQIREVQNFVRYRVERGKKAVVVNSADRFMPQAANAFLKTLEEPPADTVIILVTSSASALLPTMLSRCQRLNFRPLQDGAIASYLRDRRALSTDEAASIAMLSCGSVSKALKFVDGGLLEKRREVLERLARVAPGDADEALRLAEDLARRDDIEEILEFMKSYFRDRIVSGEGAPGLIANADISGRIRSEGGKGFRTLFDSFAMIEKARRDIMPPRYANKQLTLEALFLRITG